LNQTSHEILIEDDLTGTITSEITTDVVVGDTGDSSF